MAEHGLLGSDAMRLILPTLVDGLSDGIAIAQRLGANSPLLYVNKAFERLTGYTRNEVMGKDCRYLQGNERDQPEIARIRAAIEAGEPVDATLRNYRRDGSAFWNNLSLRPARIRDDLFLSAYCVTSRRSGRRKSPWIALPTLMARRVALTANLSSWLPRRSLQSTLRRFSS